MGTVTDEDITSSKSKVVLGIQTCVDLSGDEDVHCATSHLDVSSKKYVESNDAENGIASIKEGPNVLKRENVSCGLNSVVRDSDVDGGEVYESEELHGLHNESSFKDSSKSDSQCLNSDLDSDSSKSVSNNLISCKSKNELSSKTAEQLEKAVLHSEDADLHSEDTVLHSDMLLNPVVFLKREDLASLQSVKKRKRSDDIECAHSIMDGMALYKKKRTRKTFLSSDTEDSDVGIKSACADDVDSSDLSLVHSHHNANCEASPQNRDFLDLNHDSSSSSSSSSESETDSSDSCTSAVKEKEKHYEVAASNLKLAESDGNACSDPGSTKNKITHSIPVENSEQKKAAVKVTSKQLQVVFEDISNVQSKWDSELSRMKKYLPLLRPSPMFYKALKSSESNKLRVKLILDFFRVYGVEGRPTINKCKKAKLAHDQLAELNTLDSANVLEKRTRGPKTDKVVESIRTFPAVDHFRGLCDIISDEGESD